MDRITKERRSWNMSRIKGRNTKPELLVRKFLYSQGVRYRIHTNLPGRPDIVIKKRSIALLVNGCFWHSHAGCRYAVMPKSNTTFWKTKIAANVERDRKNVSKLTESGWNVLTVWECELEQSRDETFRNILSTLQKHD